MASFKMIPMSSSQMESLDAFLEKVDLSKRWDDLLAKVDMITPKDDNHLRCKEEFKTFIANGGNAYFNYLQIQLKDDECWSNDIHKCHSHSAFRHVWLCIEDGEPIVLVKSPLWFDNQEQCLTNGARYKPSIDYVDSHSKTNVILTIENRHVYYPDICDQPCSIYNCFAATDRFYPNMEINGRKIVQLPWSIDRPGRKLFIYCIEREDEWFYATSRSLIGAYHEYCHY